MPRYLIRLECPEERFLEWSTIVDAPITYGMDEQELRKWLAFEYGEEGRRTADSRIARCRKKGTSSYILPDLDSAVFPNRAGPDESEATLQEIIQTYCHKKRTEMGKHAREPWKWGDEHYNDLLDTSVRILMNAERAILYHQAHWPIRDANAARIVACVNACEGLNPEAVPEVLEALREMLAVNTSMPERADKARSFLDARERAVEAIIKAEEG